MDGWVNRWFIEITRKVWQEVISCVHLVSPLSFGGTKLENLSWSIEMTLNSTTPCLPRLSHKEWSSRLSEHKQYF